MKKGILVKSAILFLGLGMFVSSCSEPKEVEKVTFLEKRIFTAEDSVIDTYPRTKGEAHSGSFFSRTDSVYNYGMGTVLMVNDTNLNKDHRVFLNFWTRINQVPDSRYSVAVALHQGDSVLLWQEIIVNDKVKENNKWVNVLDSISIPANLISKPGLTIKTFTFNNTNKTKAGVFDCDDLEITYKTAVKVLEE